MKMNETAERAAVLGALETIGQRNIHLAGQPFHS